MQKGIFFLAAHKSFVLENGLDHLTAKERVDYLRTFSIEEIEGFLEDIEQEYYN